MDLGMSSKSLYYYISVYFHFVSSVFRISYLFLPSFLTELKTTEFLFDNKKGKSYEEILNILTPIAEII